MTAKPKSKRSATLPEPLWRGGKQPGIKDLPLLAAQERGMRPGVFLLRWVTDLSQRDAALGLGLERISGLASPVAQQGGVGDHGGVVSGPGQGYQAQLDSPLG